jgi:hypothetical protein
MDHPGHRTLFVDRSVSDSPGSHNSASSSLRLASDSSSPNGTNSITCGSNCSMVSVDDVIGCPSSLQPVRVVVEENSSSAKRNRRRSVQYLPPAAQPQHRSSCMFSVYQTVLACWSDWTRDPNFTSRFFFQDSRPVCSAAFSKFLDLMRLLSSFYVWACNVKCSFHPWPSVFSLSVVFATLATQLSYTSCDFSRIHE